MGEIIERSEKTFLLRDCKLPLWFVTKEGKRFEFLGSAPLDNDGRFELSRLNKGQCILYPGAIYELASAL